MPRKGQKRKIVAVIDSEDEEVSFCLKKAKWEAAEVKPRKSPNGYILPDPLPPGLVIVDRKQCQWRLGQSIGLGGFGEIYSAAMINDPNGGGEDYVVKVEPHSNGPLFVELHFYCRATKLEDLENFKAERKMTHLGIPDLKGHGSFIFNQKKLRFLVMPRYGTDLQTVLDQSKCPLSVESVSSIALQVIDSYEYLHSKGYVHKDLKGSNIIFARGQHASKQQVFLVDFGLTSQIYHKGLHKPFEPDQRSAHEGTIEYTSRDSHLGCVSRRGDIEVLLYVLIDILGGKLPWDGEETLKPTQIHEMKIDAFHDVKGFLGQAFNSASYPSFLEELMTYVKKLKFEEAPDYNYLRSLLRPFVNQEPNDEVSLCIELETSGWKKEPSVRRKVSNRRGGSMALKKQYSTSQPWSPTRMNSYVEKRKEVIRQLCENSLLNPTPAMTEQLAKIQKRAKGTCPMANSTTRRKGMVAKRRLIRRNSGDSEKKAAKPEALLPLDVSQDGDTPRIPPPPFSTVRKSPRKAIDKRVDVSSTSTFGQHLYGIVAPVSNLVKSMFQLRSRFQTRQKN